MGAAAFCINNFQGQRSVVLSALGNCSELTRKMLWLGLFSQLWCSLMHWKSRQKRPVNTESSFPLTFSSCSSNTASWTLQAKSEVGKSLKSIISSKSSSFSPKIICSSSSWSLLYRSDWLSVQDFMESLSILPPQRLQLPAGPCQPKTQMWGHHIFLLPLLKANHCTQSSNQQGICSAGWREGSAAPSRAR